MPAPLPAVTFRHTALPPRLIDTLAQTLLFVKISIRKTLRSWTVLQALLKIFKWDQTWGFTDRLSDFHQAVTLAFVLTSAYHEPPRILKMTVAFDLTCKEQACVSLFFTFNIFSRAEFSVDSISLRK